MIYNEEYARRIREGKNIPPEKWIVRTPLFPTQYGEWEREWDNYLKTHKHKLVRITYKCVVCGTDCLHVFREGKPKPSDLCFDCRQWAEAYGKRNKGQINIFEGFNEDEKDF